MNVTSNRIFNHKFKFCHYARFLKFVFINIFLFFTVTNFTNILKYITISVTNKTLNVF